MASRRRDAIYARYSSHAQDQSQTIEIQLEACRRMAGPSPLEYVDRAITGRTMHRPAFNQMLEAAEQGEFDRLILYRFDRIGRSAHTHAVVSDLEDMGIEVISTAEGKDALTRGISLVVGESFSRHLGKRIYDSQLLRFSKHQWTGGPPPFGYRTEKREGHQYLIVDPEESKTVRFVIDTYLGSTAGVKEIARRLREKNYGTRHGAPWSFTTVRQILINTASKGEIHFGKKRMKRNKATGRRVPVYNDASTHKVYTDESLRIITDQEWDRVQAKMNSRAQNRGITRARRCIRPFSGLIHCECCGSLYYAQRDGRTGRYYYTCSTCQRQGRLMCPNSPNLREDQLMADVHALYSAIFEDADWLIRETLKELDLGIAQRRGDTTRLKAEIAEIDRTAMGITRLLVDPEITKGAKDALSRQLAETEGKRTQLQIAFEDLAGEADRSAGRAAGYIEKGLERARESFQNIGTPEELHAFVERFVGPSTALREGHLLPQSNPDHVGANADVAHSNIAATGVEPVT